MHQPVLKVLLLIVSLLVARPFLTDLRAEEVLKMAVFPRKPVLETKKAFDPLVQYLSSGIGRRVELSVFKDFESFWSGIKNREYDLVHYNQYHYIKSHKELGYDVILMNEEFGSTKVNAAIVIRKDSGINTLADLKGRKIVFGGGKQAMQSYIGATQILRKAGLKAGDYTEEMSINPPNAALAVFNHLADAAGIGEVILSLSSVKERVNTDQLKVLARGEDLPMLCWGVKKELDRGLVAQIQKEMVGLRETSEGKEILKNVEATAFVPATDKDYDIVRRVVKEALGEEY
jgi:phosphonate transport system substrate-binding protein